MDFELRIDQDCWHFTQFNDLMNMLREQMAYWNNFASHEPLRVTIKKVPSQTETLGINVTEELTAEDVFGGR